LQTANGSLTTGLDLKAGETLLIRGGTSALGLAVLATISTARSQELLVAGASLDSALTGGYHLAFAISAGLVLASVAVAATVVRGGPLFTPADRGERAVVRAASENPVGHF